MDLSGKIISFLGDSITEGHSVGDIPNCRYDNIIGKAAGAKKICNYGIGGTRIAHQRRPSDKPRWDLCFCGRAYDMEPASDVIIVFGGTNDYGEGDAPFGVLTDSTPATYCGGVDFLMRLLQELYPNAQIVFLTPLRRQGDEMPAATPAKQPDAKTLLDYCRVIEQKGQEYKIPVLNLYEALNIDPNLECDRIAYTADGLHLNDIGHGMLAQCVLEFLQRL